MTRRTPVALFMLGAAATVAAAAWWLGDNPLTDPAAAALTHPLAVQESDPQPPAPELGDEPLPPLDHADDGLSDEDLWAYIADPARSDLPPETFAELSELGADIIRADATGHGRDRWPHYWQSSSTAMGKAEPCCTDIVIHAAGATTDPTSTDRILVTVAWSPAGSRADADDAVHVTTVQLERGGEYWHPAR